MKTIIERGASWTLEETKMLLALWGQDYVKRQATNQKRTKQDYERMSEKFNQNGFERTADQVRTRVFNMIAEYRRILKDPNPERIKKCIFFEALHKIYQAKHMDDIKSALDDYEPDYPNSPVHSSDKGDESVSDSEAVDGNETGKTVSSKQQHSTTPNNDSNKTNDSKNGDNTPKASNAKSFRHRHIRVMNPLIGTESPSPEPKSPPHETASTSANANNTNNTNSNTLGGTGATATAATTTTATVSNDELPEHSTLKKCKLSSTGPQVATTATTIGVGAASSSTSTPSTQRHQSLLLPHATSSGTATPISKFTTTGNNTPSYININSTTKLPIIRTNQLIGHSNGVEPINLNGTATRLPTTAAITSHQLYQAPVNTFDVTSSALLIDRMFAHLSRESENMREWIALEKERLALERTRRQQETEREHRRDRVLVDTLMKFQDQWLTYMHHLDPRFPLEPKPELKIGTKDSSSSATGDAPQSSAQSTITLTSGSSAPTNPTTTTTTATAATTNTTTTDCSASEESKPTQ